MIPKLFPVNQTRLVDASRCQGRDICEANSSTYLLLSSLAQRLI